MLSLAIGLGVTRLPAWGAELHGDSWMSVASLRRIKASIIYKARGDLRAVQILLGHAKIESTVRYLCVNVEDTLEQSERTEM